MLHGLTRSALAICLVGGTVLPLTLASQPAWAQIQAVVPIGSFKLPGGVEIITSEDHAKPVAILDTWIAVGSSSDFTGYPGVAATLAQTLWLGGKQPLSRGIAALGGEGMVEVGHDFTHIQVKVPAAKLEAGVTLLGEAFSRPDWENMSLEPAMIALGASVDQLERDPQEAAIEQFTRAAYGPVFGHPVAGQQDRLRRLTRGDVQAFFERFYLPNRFKVVVVGDFNTGRSVGMIVRSYAAVLQRTRPAGPAPSRPLGNLGSDRWKAPVSVVVAGALGPAIQEQREQAAMEILLQILAARLEKAFAESNNARVLGARLIRFGGPAAMVLVASGPDEALDGIDRQIRESVGDLGKNLASLDEHSRAVRKVAEKATGAGRSLGSLASALGFSAAIAADPYWARTYPEVVRQVSRQDMLAIAQKYLTPESLKVLMLKP